LPTIIAIASLHIHDDSGGKSHVAGTKPRFHDTAGAKAEIEPSLMS
jgi:hypothetical protein